VEGAFQEFCPSAVPARGYEGRTPAGLDLALEEALY
jgi:hypothetical protein